MHRIEIEGRYAYETDLDVEVGDEVLLPASSWTGQWVDRVTALSADYDGRCSRVVGLVRRRAAVEEREAKLAAVAITGFQVGSTVKAKALCGHEIVFCVREVNRLGRPTSVEGVCDRCQDRHGVGLGSADAWRSLAAGLS